MSRIGSETSLLGERHRLGPAQGHVLTASGLQVTGSRLRQADAHPGPADDFVPVGPVQRGTWPRRPSDAGTTSVTPAGPESPEVIVPGASVPRSLDSIPDAPYRYEIIDPPKGYPRLDWRPAVLSPGMAATLCLLYSGVLAGLIVLLIKSWKDPYLDTRNVNWYLAARYGPGVVGVLTTISFRAVLHEYLRILPYINMANVHVDSLCANGMSTIASGYWPLLHRPNTWETWMLGAVQFLAGFLTATKALLFHVADNGYSWGIVSYSIPAIALAVFYLMAILVLIIIQVRLWGKPTGIREDWQPECFADIIALFRWSNFPMDALYDVKHRTRHLRRLKSHLLGTARVRIGYWKRVNVATNEEDILYSIRALESPSPQCRPAVRDQLDRGYPYRFCPFISKMWLCVCLIIALGIFALLLVLAVQRRVRTSLELTALIFDWNNATLSSGPPSNITIAGTDYGGVRWFQSPHADQALLASLLVRTLPLFAVSMVLNYTLVMDTCFRCTQPIHNMLEGSVSAEQSILLQYLTQHALQVPIDAFSRGHWKVLFYSVLATVSPVLLLVPWGVLELTYTPERRLIGTVSMSSYIGTLVILAVAIGALLVAWPQDRRKMPRPDFTLVDIWAMCHASWLAHLDTFGRCGASWSRDMMHSEIKLKQHQYALGICRGADDRDRVGFDIMTEGPEHVPTDRIVKVKPRSWWRRVMGRNGKETTTEDYAMDTL